MHHSPKATVIARDNYLWPLIVAALLEQIEKLDAYPDVNGCFEQTIDFCFGDSTQHTSIAGQV
jgi:hypothetical protein